MIYLSLSNSSCNNGLKEVLKRVRAICKYMRTVNNEKTRATPKNVVQVSLLLAWNRFLLL